MTQEIKRNRWSQFFRKFNAANQYRQSTISVEKNGEKKAEVNANAPFLGIAVSKKGRLIDSVNIFSGRFDPEKISEPVISVRQPAKVEVEKDDDGTFGCFAVHSDDGSIARVELTGEKKHDLFHTYVEQVAYRIAESRGFAPGNPVEDWLEAEKMIKAAEGELI